MTVRNDRHNAGDWNVQGMLDEMRADYLMGKTGRFRRRLTGVATMGSHADYHYRSEPQFLRIMEQAREYDRNDMVVGAGVDRLIQNVHQEGFKLDPQTGDDGLNLALMERWNEWAEDKQACDVAGEATFHSMVESVLRAVIVDGDIFVLPKKDGRLEHIEAHRCRTPSNTKRNVVHGVLLNDQRRHVEYWFTKEDVDPYRPLIKVGQTTSVAVYNGEGRRQAWQIKHSKRISQTRGVSAFCPIVNAIGMHDDLQFSKLVQAQIASCFAIIHERALDFTKSNAILTGNQSIDTADGSTRTIENISPGMRVYGNPGEKLQGFSPNVPNPEFFQHAYMILTFVAVNLNLPLQIMLLDPRQTNFSGWRGATDQARMGFRRFQRWLIREYHKPIYRWKVASWIVSDGALRRNAARDGIDIYRHRWNAPGWPYIEPNKDAQADATRQNNRLISPRRLHAERGRDWEEVAQEIVDDNALIVERAIAAAAMLNEKYPAARVDWRELASFTKAKPQNTRNTGNVR